MIIEFFLKDQLYNYYDDFFANYQYSSSQRYLDILYITLEFYYII